MTGSVIYIDMATLLKEFPERDGKRSVDMGHDHDHDHDREVITAVNGSLNMMTVTFRDM